MQVIWPTAHAGPLSPTRLPLNAVDFGDLLLHVLTIFQAHPDVLAEYHRITHIMVDEYQDTNVAQYLWLRLLTGPDRNLCCVGDTTSMAGGVPRLATS